MFKNLLIILDIQDLDMKMLRLLQLRKTHRDQLQSIQDGQQNLKDQIAAQQEKTSLLKREIALSEEDVSKVTGKIKELEAKQSLVKKVDEFNALTHETSAAERERTAKDQRLSNLQDVLSNEDETLKGLQQALQLSIENNKSVQEEIEASIREVNKEGRALKSERDRLAVKADEEVLSVYERLLRNKKDRVVVPIENRCCSGCHIMLTAQDENLVRKGERMVFCEHCSRIHYWQESQELATGTVAPKPRRRKKA
jgi:predicted  nucleic acid-binding Zn-ribbon protein